MILNPEQKKAVAHRNGPLLVLAGAGAGKTRVLTERIAGMIDDGIPAEQILALTFTNKAAGEMRERVHLRTKGKAKKLTLSTFHSLGLRLVQEHAQELGFAGQVSVLDESEQRALLRRVLSRVKQSIFGNDTDKASQAISEARSEGLDAAALQSSDSDAVYALGLILERYQEEKAELAGVDFDDLIHLPIRLLQNHEKSRTKLQKRWPYLLIDEFQDTSVNQLRFLQLLAGESGNIMVVGDDDQAIYEWRGACAENILNFHHHFPGAKVVTLDRNYRSKARILDAANRVIRYNKRRRQKTLKAHQSGDAEVVRRCYQSGDLEAEVICQDIARAIRQGTPAEAIAVLMRRNVQAAPFEEELARRQVGFRLVGGKRTADKKAARDLFAYLSVTGSGKNELAFRRAITTPARGLAATSLDRIVASGPTVGGDLLRVNASTVEGLAAKRAQVLTEFQQLILKARQMICAPGARPGAIFRDLFHDVGYHQRLEQEITNARLLARQIGDLDRTLNLLDSAWNDPALGAHPRQRLIGFVNRMLLAGAQDEANDDEGKVTLSTIHGVKGLEYDRVYIVGLEEGYLPTQSAIDDGNLEEERRLLYVAITRAKNTLHLSRAASRRQGKREVERIPSRFLIEAGLEEAFIDEPTRRDDVEMTQDMAALRARLAEQGIQMPEWNP